MVEALMNSPLGKYAPLVASVTAVGVIGAYILAVLLGAADVNLNDLKDFALIAIGAVFGSAAGVNGWRRDVTALHARLDNMAAPPAGDGTAAQP